ncbi:NAD(P)-binding protein [Atractiella rhizophila]|nr:NAD(P)-binding protein [Atractiella rhizophila]
MANCNADIKRSNDALDLSSKQSAVVGGTQGIGEAIAIRLASLGSDVIIIGRNKELGNQVIRQMREVARDESVQTFEFFPADLSEISEMKRLAAVLSERCGNRGIHFLFQTQGGPPNGQWKETVDGLEHRFAVQILSRFALPYLLASSGTLKESVASLADPGGKTEKFDGDDLDLRKVRQSYKLGPISHILASARRDGVVTDAMTLEFNERFPHLKAIHLFPGIVPTKAASNMGFPFPIPQLSASLLPVFSFLTRESPNKFADVRIFLAANPVGKQLGIHFARNTIWNPYKVVDPNAWGRVKENRAKVWANLERMLFQTEKEGDVKSQ